MKRRDFLKSSAAAVAGASVATRFGFGQNQAEPGSQPNILFILVDELRWPTVFPLGVHDADGFFRRFMPNLYRNIWQKGVKFGNYHTASNACTPARGTIITGLYSQQSWLLTTILAQGPVLNPAFPTYGRLLQAAGYTTPYRGKWHVSIPSSTDTLSEYGFDYDSYPDPTGSNLQGTYGDTNANPPYHNDAYTANQAIDYLKTVTPNQAPWCLTVGFVNPHDREFFPAGTEFQTFTNLFSEYNKLHPNNELDQFVDYSSSGPQVPWAEDKLKSPPNAFFPPLPPNWETPATLKLRQKPTTHIFMHEFSQAVWGGVSNNPLQNGFHIIPYGNGDLGLGVGKAPFDYWQRGFDSYAQIIRKVDEQIGAVVDQLNCMPQSVIDNTIIVFASDHGEYSGAHGFVQGKLGTTYEEALHIPLIVMDPSGRFTGDTDTIRTGLTSSVDLLRMLVTLGNKGSTNWLRQSPNDQIYGQRHDMYSMLKSRWAPGRDYILFATDEIAPDFFNFNNAPLNILALRTDDTKVGVYADWKPLSTDIDPRSVQLEFYDYSTEGGRLELANRPKDPRAEQGYDALTQNLIPNEMQQPLPGSPLDPNSLRAQQIKAKIAHIAFRDLIKNYPESVWEGGGLTTILGYGGPF